MIMVKCPNCGNEVSSTDKRCRKCGTDVKKNSNKLLIAILAIVAIIAIVGIFASGVLSNDNANHVSDSSGNDAVFWASSEGNKFHKPNCEWAQKIKESNKVVYTSREAAIEDGREPCGECNP